MDVSVLETGGTFGVTVWTGTTITYYCQFNPEIVLLHGRFTSAYGTCNNGAIVARGKSVEGNNYTSQLNFTATNDNIEKTIECLCDNQAGTVTTLFHLVSPTTGLSHCKHVCFNQY